MSYPLECQSTFCHPCSVFFWPYILIMGTLLEDFLFFIWENFLFDADCAILVNHCCSFLKGWYGREASKVSWVSYHLRLLFTSWSCLQPQQGSHSAIYDHRWGSYFFSDVGPNTYFLVLFSNNDSMVCLYFLIKLGLLRPYCFRRPKVLLCRESGRLCDSRLHSHGAFWDPHLTKSSLTLVISQVQVPASFVLQIILVVFSLVSERRWVTYGVWHQWGTFTCPEEESEFTSQTESHDQYDLRKQGLREWCKQDFNQPTAWAFSSPRLMAVT